MTISTSNSSRLNLRTTAQQDTVLRRAAELAELAELADKSLTDFILDSACQVAERDLLSIEQARIFIERLDQPAQDNPGLQDLLSRPVPWNN